MKVTIRKSVPNDVYEIREIQRITWPITYPNSQKGITKSDIQKKFEIDETPEGKKKIEERKKYYKNKHIRIWVAQAEDKVIGYCMTMKEKEYGRVGAIYVLPNYQGRGVGELLIRKALKWLGGKKNIMINVARYNKQAIAFYEKFGFVKTGKAGALDSAAKLPSGKFIPEIELVKICSVK